MVVPRVNSFVDAALFYNPLDPAQADGLARDATTGAVILEELGYRAEVTTFEVDQGLERLYALGSRAPVDLVPLRWEARVSATFIPTTLTGLEKLASLAPSGTDVLRFNLFVSHGGWAGATDVYLREVVARSIEISAREGDVVEASFDGVYHDIYIPATPPGVQVTPVSGTPLTFAQAVLTVAGKQYPTRDVRLRIGTGHEVGWTLGDRRFSVVWQGRQELTVRATVYGSPDALNDLAVLAGATDLIEPAVVQVVIQDPAGNAGTITVDGAKIASIGAPVRVGEAIMIDVELYGGSISFTAGTTTTTV